MRLFSVALQLQKIPVPTPSRPRRSEGCASPALHGVLLNTGDMLSIIRRCFGRRQAFRVAVTGFEVGHSRVALNQQGARSSWNVVKGLDDYKNEFTQLKAHGFDTTQWYAGELERLHDQHFDFYLHVSRATAGEYGAQTNAVLIVSHAHTKTCEYQTHVDTAALASFLADEGIHDVKTVGSVEEREAAGLYFGSLDAAVRRRASDGSVKPVLLMVLPEKLCVLARAHSFLSEHDAEYYREMVVKICWFVAN